VLGGPGIFAFLFPKLMLRLSLSLTLFAVFSAAALADEIPGGHPKPRDDAQDTVAVTAGSGAHTYRTVPNWGDVPHKLQIGPTHGGVAVDKAGLIYVSSDSAKGIYVFQPGGQLVRTIAADFYGIHGLCLREENGEEFIYAAHLKGQQAVKLKLDGTPVLVIPFPPETGALYPNGVKDYKPTAIAVAPDGSIFVSDGYGLSFVHKFDASGKYLKSFGGKGKEDGKFATSHGLAIDTRFGAPLLLVCDRANRRLQHLDLDGNFVGVITTDLRLPCAVSMHGEFVAIAELQGRVTIIDKSNKVVATLGENNDPTQSGKFDVPPEVWKQGVFTAPHGLSYDPEGNLYVQDWNKTGRVTKLVKVKP
jgi:DNA-binding beta-propeller fold protein YncE